MIFLQNLKVIVIRLRQYWFLFLIVIFNVVISWPDRLGKSFYTASELPRDLGILTGISHGQFILVGPDSCLGNFHFGPVYYYLAYPITYLFHLAPFSLAAASIFFNALTIIASFYVAEKWWQNRIFSYSVALFMSTSIFTFQFSQYGSNPNFLPLFCLLFFYALERLFQKPKSLGYTALLAVCFGVATQLHAVPLLCLPLILFYSLIIRKLTITWKSAFLFLVIVGLIFYPYLFFEFTHNFPNIRALFQIAANSGFHTSLTDRMVEYLGFWFAPVLSVHQFFDIFDVAGPSLFYWFAGCLLFLLPILKFEPKFKKPILPLVKTPDNVKTIMKYWFIIPSLVIILASSNANGLRLYYFLMLYPAIFFLFTLGLFKLAQTKRVVSVVYIIFVYVVFQGAQIFIYRSAVNHLITWVYK